jgi:hypothetical protein
MACETPQASPPRRGRRARHCFNPRPREGGRRSGSRSLRSAARPARRTRSAPSSEGRSTAFPRPSKAASSDASSRADTIGPTLRAAGRWGRTLTISGFTAKVFRPAMFGSFAAVVLAIRSFKWSRHRAAGWVWGLLCVSGRSLLFLIQDSKIQARILFLNQCVVCPTVRNPGAPVRNPGDSMRDPGPNVRDPGRYCEGSGEAPPPSSEVIHRGG